MNRAECFAKDPTATLLLEGESGTGKTQLARYLHEISPRARRPFQSVVLSTVEDSLAGSELFGHVTGAFTDARCARAGHFACANGGTLFLDEIGKASAGVQQKLLHAIEYREFRPVGADHDTKVDVRVIAASNLPLQGQVDTGKFLPDLFARLAVFTLRLPSLRERRADIPALARHAVATHAHHVESGSTPALSSELVHALQAAPWPNNLRQLDATLHRILVESGGAPVLTLEHCRDDLAYLRDFARVERPVPNGAMVENAIREAGGVSAAARALGVHRTTLHRMRQKQGGARTVTGHPVVRPTTDETAREAS